MVFRTRKTPGKVVKAFDLRLILTAADFPTVDMVVTDLFKQKLTLTLDNLHCGVRSGSLR